MRNNLHTLAFALITSFASINASAEFFKNGSDLSKEALAFDRVAEGRASSADFQQSAAFNGYIAGAVDVLHRINICPPSGTTLDQIASIVSKYLKAHPERWGNPGEAIILNSLRPVFPCK